MTAFWSGSVRTFVDTPATEVAGVLALAQVGHFRVNEVQPLPPLPAPAADTPMQASLL